MIVSKTNETIKRLTSLKEKKYRDKYNQYIIEGLKLTHEIINSKDIAFEFIIYSEEIVSKIKGYELLKEDLKKINNKKLIEVSKDIYVLLADTVTPQGVLVVVNKENKKLIVNENEKYIVLDKIQDAGNLGTIIRSAVSFGVKNIICIKGTVDAYSPKVVRSTMGAILRVNIIEIDDEKELLKLKDSSFKIISTSLATNKYLKDVKKSNKNVYVFGNESQGVSNYIYDISDEKVKIEMEEIQESLNVSQAATICMYEEYIN